MHIVLHWDGKLVPDIDKKNKGSLVWLSGKPDYEEGKLLAVLVISKGTGEEITKSLFNVAIEWEINSTVCGLVFDTTASNSGCRIDACF